MKYLVAAICFFGSFLCQAYSIAEDDIIGTYLLAPHESINTEEDAHNLPVFFTLTADHMVDFVFDGEPSIASLCKTNWVLKDTVLQMVLDCTSIFSEMKPMVAELDLSNVPRESFIQAKEMEIIAQFYDLIGTNKNFHGPMLLTKVPQEPLNLNELFIFGGEGTGLKRGRIDPEIGCCIDKDCNTSLPCHEVELSYTNGQISIRLIFDTNIEDLDTVDLLQNHLGRAYLEIGFKISSRELEVADAIPTNIVFDSLSDGKVRFNISGIIDTLRRHTWEGGLDGEQVYEKKEVSIPYSITFDLEILS